MPTTTLYLNGFSAGTPGFNPVASKRGFVNGWSNDAVRRHTRWLYSIDAFSLTGDGWSGSLTMRDTPATSVEFHAARRAFLRRLERSGVTRLHWVVEWQRRGTPHLHIVCFWDGAPTADAQRSAVEVRRWVNPADQVSEASPAPSQGRTEEPSFSPQPDRRRTVLDAWASTFGQWTVGDGAQDSKPIYDALGWLKYLSKHAGRGAAHYQRQGKPMGWEKTGRLWGKTGDWPEVEPLKLDLSGRALWELRHLARSWRVADARKNPHLGENTSEGRAARRRLVSARQMLKCPEQKRSTVRGLSEWAPHEVSYRWIALLSDRGHLLLEPSPRT